MCIRDRAWVIAPFAVPWHFVQVNEPSSSACARDNGPGEICAPSGTVHTMNTSAISDSTVPTLRRSRSLLPSVRNIRLERDLLVHHANAYPLEERRGRVAPDAYDDIIVRHDRARALHVEHDHVAADL